MKKYLTLFTIGPVQSFIAKARKLQDLYAGSFLLSHLSKKTAIKAEELGASVLFPDLKQQSAPNRFLFTIEKDTPDELRTFCKMLETYVRDEWTNIAKKVFAETKLVYNTAVAAQIESLIQVFYAAEEYSGGEHFGECYIKVIKKLGSAKTLREFCQLEEPYGRKCNLMYEHNALFYREKKNYLAENAQKVTRSNIDNLDKFIRPDETLCAVSFAKRCLNFAVSDFNDNFPSVSDVYKGKDGAGEVESGCYAVVMFDGDDMGKWYSKPDEKGVKEKSKTEEFQKALSGEVSKFAAEHSHTIVDWKSKKNGVVIYAGGEDFLGAFNLKSVFPALGELRKTFGEIDLSKYTEKKLTFSAGVVIAHVKTPLSVVLEMARKAEHKAKEFPDKDAFCIKIARRSGEITEFVLPFNTLNDFDSLVKVIEEYDLSVKFTYTLGSELGRIAEKDDAKLNKEIFLAEARRIITHSEFKDKDKIDETVNTLKRLSEVEGNEKFNLENMLMCLNGAAFIARERGRS